MSAKQKSNKVQGKPKQQDKKKQYKNSKKGNNKKKTIVRNDTRAVAIMQNKKITPDTALVIAQGVRDNIQVLITLDNPSLLFMPVGLISLAMARGLTDVSYSVYKIIYDDITSLIKGRNGTAPSRFVFQNKIYGALVPKNIPFRIKCAIQYGVSPFDSSSVANSIGTHNGKTYYMWSVGTPNLVYASGTSSYKCR